jgi:hypothetical protein
MIEAKGNMFKIMIVEDGYHGRSVEMTENDLRRFIKMNPDANWEYDHT